MDVNGPHALCSPRVNRPAILATAFFLVRVELLKDWRKVPHNALEPNLRSMHQVVAIRAIPLEGVHLALGTRHLDHQAYGVGLTLRRVSNMLGKKKNLTFLNRNVLRRLARLFDDAQNNVALKLVEK